MNHSVQSTLADEPPNQTPDFTPPVEADLKFMDFLRFATEEIESNIKAGRVIQQQIDAQRLQINDAIARLIAA